METRKAEKGVWRKLELHPCRGSFGLGAVIMGLGYDLTTLCI
jgi:hypothetical protein